MRFTMDTTGTPASATGALLPIPAVASLNANTYGGTHIFGQPGTMGIPAPKPNSIPETAAGWRGNQGSYCSPDVWFPSIYYTTPENNHPPVNLLQDNPMPVPAVSPRQLPGISQRMRRVGGQNQVGQPGAIQTWPQWTGQGR